jgi:hypothetical protein
MEKTGARTPCDLSGWMMCGPISGSAASSWPIRLMIFFTFAMSVSAPIPA